MSETHGLRESMDRIVGPVDTRGVWDSIETRAATGKGGATPGPGASRRRRIRLVYAAVALLVLTGAVTGGVLGVKHLTERPSVMVIDDGPLTGTGGTPGAASAVGTWEKLSLTWEGGSQMGLSGVVVSPTDGAVLYVGTTEGLFKSTNGAGSWTRVLSCGAGDYFAAVDPASPSTIYVTWTAAVGSDWGAITSHRMLRSDDAGTTWVELGPNALIDATVKEFQTSSSFGMAAVTIDARTQPSTLYAMADSGYWRSTDRGLTWSEADLNDEERQAISSGEPESVASLRGKALADPDTGGGRTIQNAVLDPADAATVYAVTQEGLYKSTDGGGSWKRATTGLTSAGASALLFSPDTSSTLYATTPAGLLKSTDHGKTWEMCLRGGATMGGAGGVSCSAVAAPSDVSVLYVWNDDGVFRSDDAGASWKALACEGLLVGTPQFTGFSDQVILVSLDDPDVVFARGTTFVYRSADGGKTWTQIQEGVSVIFPDPHEPETLFALGNQGLEGDEIWKSTDKGITWKPITTPGGGVLELALDRSDPASLYQLTLDAQHVQQQAPITLSRSLDGGATWVAPDLQPPLPSLGTLVFDPQAPDTVYFLSRAGQDGTYGVDIAMFRSIDRGVTWEDITGAVKDLVDAQPFIAPDGTLYVCSEYGVYRWVPPEATTGTTEQATATTEPATPTSMATSPTDSFRRGYEITREASETRQSNLRKATAFATGITLAPGEVYDFKAAIEAKEASQILPAYTPGKPLERSLSSAWANDNVQTSGDDDLAGAINQVATALFNAAFEAGLQIVERHNLPVYVADYPDGRDVAVNAGGNFRFRNDTAGELTITGTCDGTTTSVEIAGYSDGRTVTSTFSGFTDYYGGRTCTVVRTVRYANGTTQTDTFYSSYPMMPYSDGVAPTDTSDNSHLTSPGPNGAGATTTTATPVTTLAL